MSKRDAELEDKYSQRKHQIRSIAAVPGTVDTSQVKASIPISRTTVLSTVTIHLYSRVSCWCFDAEMDSKKRSIRHENAERFGGRRVVTPPEWYSTVGSPIEQPAVDDETHDSVTTVS